MQGASAPDLKEFEKGSHGYILFDNVNVNDMQFVLDHRGLVQSNNSVHRLGRVWLFNVPTVMTVDDSAVEADQAPGPTVEDIN